MSRLCAWILDHRRAVVCLAVAAALLGLVGMTQVQVNYNLADYLPSDAPSTQALQMLTESGMGGVPNLQVMVREVSIPEALEIKAALSALDGVSQVLWLDDVADIYTPAEMLGDGLVSAWYQDQTALFLLTGEETQGASLVAAIEAAYPQAVLAGELVNQTTLRTVSMGEVGAIMLYVVPLVLIILLLCTGSWLEPILFVAVIGLAILMNEGTNCFLGEVSFITQASSAILQLAVSIDYAVFLLHRFSDEREKGTAPREAMLAAMRASGPAIAASALTTVFGFLALALMRFRMGADMGIVLAKGILLSYLSVMLVLPALTLMLSKAIEKTRHKMFLPKFTKLGRLIVRFGAPLAAAALIALVPAFLGQQRNDFVYGSSGMYTEDSPVMRSAEEIAQVFGQQQQLLLLVPEGEPAKEAALSQALSQVPGVSSVTSYATAAGVEIPDILVPAQQLSQLRAGGYSRIILYASGNDEGAEIFRLVERVRALAQEAYGENAYLIGQCVVNYDLKQTITGDNLRVLLGGIGAIFLVLLFSFRGLTLPLLLMLVIEGAVWLNLCLPYFTGSTLNYIGYQIVSSVQLGATVDYGILLAQQYLAGRKALPKKEAAAQALGYAIRSILPPCLTLATAGTLLGLISSNGVISQMGLILGRGAAISGGMVIVVLPLLLVLCDRVIEKTTLGRKEKKE